MQAECIVESGCELGEGPLWVPETGVLWWVDIFGDSLHAFRPATGVYEKKEFGQAVTSISLRVGGGFIATTRKSVVYLDAEGAIEREVESIEADLPRNRFNDAKVDPRGRLWAGTMDDGVENATGRLYRLTQEGLRAFDEGYVVTNGPAFSLDGRVLYHASSIEKVVYAFDLADDGALTNKRAHIVFAPEDGGPDGMTTDVEGGLWIAHFGGARVTRFTPDGRKDRHIDVPASNITSCAFGGEGLDELYITSAWIDLSDAERAAQPLAGGLFRADPGVRGLAPFVYDPDA